MSIEPGIYKHHKGNLYEVIGVGRHSQTLEEVVIYRAQYTSARFGKNALWARPKQEFLDTVTVDGKTMPRFSKVKK